VALLFVSFSRDNLSCDKVQRNLLWRDVALLAFMRQGQNYQSASNALAVCQWGQRSPLW